MAQRSKEPPSPLSLASPYLHSRGIKNIVHHQCFFVQSSHPRLKNKMDLSAVVRANDAVGSLRYREVARGR